MQNYNYMKFKTKVNFHVLRTEKRKYPFTNMNIIIKLINYAVNVKLFNLLIEYS